MVATMSDLRREIDEIMPGVVADRRHLHQHPELGFQEFETAKFVAERLQSLGVEDIRTGIAVTGVIGLIRGTKPGAGKVVLLRADMDALPIQEENEVDYKSTVPGKMHACGHDAHTAGLLGVARLLMDRRDQFSGTVKLLFQPAEEGGGGALVMINKGVMDDPRVDAAFGLHVDQNEPVGTISLRAGDCSAAADRFGITIKGRGGHGANPHEAVDPIAVGAQIVTALQAIVDREVDPVDPAVVTVGAFLAGEAANVIPDTAELRGTLRSFNPDVRAQIATRTEEIARGIAKAMRADIEFVLAPGYPSIINDPEMTELVRQIACEVVGEEKVLETPLQMGAEDFSYFVQLVPGAFFQVGSKNVERGLVWGHHHPKFDLDEEFMVYGMETMVRTAIRYLNG
jgi:amidohydrolase